MQALFYWPTWALILIVQNFAFTFVSRARNSGSVSRHAIAALGSNGVWFISQLFIFSRMFNILTGKEGWVKAVLTGLFYTGFTLVGSLTAHYWALHTEKGKGSVGANKKYAQVPIEEWLSVKTKLGI